MDTHDVQETKYRPVTGFVREALLGMVIGNGSIRWEYRKTREQWSGRVYMTHGEIQKDYCCHKAELLKDYVNVLPKIRKNKGWGKKSCVFSTVTSPAFDFLFPLFYKIDGRTKRPKKILTKEAVDQMTPVSWAYLFMDDGHSSTTQTSATINTQNFTRKDVEKLVAKLNSMGIAAEVKHDNHMKKAKIGGWYVYMGAEATRKFINMVKPHLHESMAYKGVVNEQPVAMVQCQFCGTEIPYGNRKEGNMVACPAKECQLERHRILSTKHIEKDREHAREIRRKSYRKNLEANRKKKREQAVKKMQDPEHRARVNEQKRKRRAEKRAQKTTEMVSCSFCGDLIPRGNRRKDAPTIACSKHSCKKEKHRLNSIAWREKLKASA